MRTASFTDPHSTIKGTYFSKVGTSLFFPKQGHMDIQGIRRQLLSTCLHKLWTTNSAVPWLGLSLNTNDKFLYFSKIIEPQNGLDWKGPQGHSAMGRDTSTIAGLVPSLPPARGVVAAPITQQFQSSLMLMSLVHRDPFGIIYIETVFLHAK